jgi:copper transport protein
MVAVLACLMVGVAPSSTAHASLEWSQPADHASVDAPPGRVLMGWLGPIDIAHARVEVLDPDGVSHQTARPAYGVNGAVVVSTDARGPGGQWLVRYAIPSLDGHVSRGSFAFDVAHGRDRAGGSHGWLYAGGAAGLLALVVVLGLGARGRAGRPA